MSQIIDLNDFANGAAKERINRELQTVLENIADPNTDPKKKRTLTMTLTMSADDERDIVLTDIVVKSKLAPAKPIGTKIMIDMDAKGNLIGQELKSGIKGQTFITDDGEFAEDNGKVIDFKATKQK